MNIIRSVWNIILFITVVTVFKDNVLLKKMLLISLVKLKNVIIYLLNNIN